MQTYIALLRGINIGGRKKVLMKDLKQIFLDLSFSNIHTYIQTGNILFSSHSKENPIELANKIKEVITINYDFEVPIIVKKGNEWNTLVANNPFTKKEEIPIEYLHATFLKETPPKKQIEELEKNTFSPDQFKIIDKTVYIYCPRKYSETKLGNTFLEKKLKVQATTRNWKTVLKILELSKNE